MFDPQTRAKAKHSWRLLIVDGHASHISMEFINYYNHQKALLVVFPPHYTHTLQQLDVVLFKSFSSAYTKELINFQSKSQRSPSLVKSDPFNLFWRAWNLAFNKGLIPKAFEATGLAPQNASDASEHMGTSPVPIQCI